MTNPERLDAWLKKEERNRSWLARKIDRWPAQVMRYISGENKPSEEAARKIHKITSGAVPFDGWID